MTDRGRVAGRGVVVAGTAPAAVRLGRRAERAGFETLWTTEFCHRTALAPMAALAVATERIGIGSAIAYAFGRSPVLLAAAARDVDELSGGRMVLGLGAAQPARRRDWLGTAPDHPVERLAEVLELVRSLWDLDLGPVDHRGRFHQVNVVPTGHVPPPRRRRPPILIAAVNRRMLELAGRAADGVITHPIHASALDDQVRPVLTAAADRAGRDTPRVVTMVITVVDDDADVARRAAAAQIAFYAQHGTYADVFARMGFGDAAAGVRSAASRGDWPAMVASVPPAMVDRMTLAGRPDEVRDRAAELSRRHEHLAFHTPSMLQLRPDGAGLRDIGADAYEARVEALIDTLGPGTGASGSGPGL